MARIMRLKQVCITSAAAFALSACADFDLDLRDMGGDGFDTSRAVQDLPNRPRPDDRGVISYPNYQVVVAQRDDTIRAIAIRLGLDANELADYNGIEPDAILRRDEIVALPSRVAEPTMAGGAPVDGPIPTLDVAAVATSALDRADADSAVSTTTLDPVTPTATQPTTAPVAASPVGTAPEPIRHQVVRGETVYAISRLYDVPVRNIAEWNGLDAEFTVREGQYLLIPQSAAAVLPVAVPAPTTVTEPGEGTETPVPPSAATPLPDVTPEVALPVTSIPDAPDLGAEPAAPETPAGARFSYPVQGNIIRAYSPGTNEGIDIGAPVGTDVKAADSGSVVAVTNSTGGVAIVVIRHNDGLLTVYTNMDNLTVSKGDNVSRGQAIGKVRDGNPSFVHFEVRRGMQSVDPEDFLP